VRSVIVPFGEENEVGIGKGRIRQACQGGKEGDHEVLDALTVLVEPLRCAAQQDCSLGAEVMVN